jgi:hypothetical protein
MPDLPTFSFLAGAPAGDPLSQNAMALRQRMALAMMSQQKGYPKNLGEGLTEVGRSLGDIGMMRRLEAQQAAFENATKGAAAERDKVAPVPTASIEPTTQTAEVAPSWLNANAMMQPSTEQPAAPVQEAGTAPQGNEVYPQTAALETPSTASDAPPIGVQPAVQRGDLSTGSPADYLSTAPAVPPTARAAIARSLMQRNSPSMEVPQSNQNPMLAGQSPAAMPSTLNPEDLGSPPEAANNRPITVPNIQLAQRGQPTQLPTVYVGEPPPPQGASTQVPAPRPAPQPMLTPGPAAPAPDPNALAKPTMTQPPAPFPKDPQQAVDERLAREAAAIGNTGLEKFYTDRVAKWEALRASKDARILEQWKMKNQKELQDEQLWTSRQRDLPKIQAETAKAQSEAAIAADKATISARAGGVDPNEVVKDFQARSATQKANVDMLRQAKIAMEALNNGIVSGVGANVRVDMERLKAWMFNNKSANDIATQSQIFQSAVSSMLGGGVQSIQPHGGPTTETDMKIARGIVGASPEMQEAAKRRLIGSSIEKLHNDINEYEDKASKVFGGLKAHDYFSVRTDPIHDDKDIAKKYVDRLLEHSDSKAAREIFDEKFGRGSAQLEIDRAARNKRYPRSE